MSSDFSDANLTGLRPAPAGQDSDSSVCSHSEKTLGYSPVPRRPSSKDMYENTGDLKDSYTDDMIAPQGFEPEGSATKPKFCEGSSTFVDFISDRNGFALFREYLREQKHESLLDFCQSCEEFKRLANTGSNLATHKASSIYNNYLHSKHLCANILKDDVYIRAKLKHKLSGGQPLSETLFDHAKQCILQYITEFHYGRFLGSDIYMRSDVSKAFQSKDRISTKCVPRYGPKGLPPLLEEKVYEQNAANWPSPDVNTKPLGRAVDDREEYVPVNLSLTKATLAGMFQQPTPPVVSVNTSDVQSLSSDALTDDTKSTVTDFSDMTTKSNEKRSGFQDVAGFVPRTKRLTKASRQLPPDEFAKILIEKLEKVVIQREQEERAALNLACLPHEHVRGSKKSILEDAAERHHQFQKYGSYGLGLPPAKYTEPCYPMPSNTMPPFVHTGYIDQQGVAGYYPTSVENGCNANPTWHEPEAILEKRPQCAPLGNCKKQWESVGTIESAPDSGVSIEEDYNLPPETRNRIHEWMELSEKEVSHIQGNCGKPRTKQSYNTGVPGGLHGTMHLAPVAQDSLMPPLNQPDSRTTIEEVSRRLSHKDVREKRSKSHKNRTGYLSAKSSQGACPQFSADSKDCSSSIVSRDFHPPGMYSSSSVLSSVPSTVGSKDSGVGRATKGSRPQDGTKIVYYLDGEKYPYQSILPDKVVYLRQFKELVAFKKGNYRYFFKTPSDEEDCGAVYVEIMNDESPLPAYGNKIICKVKESKHL